MTILHSHYLVGIFSKTENEILHRAPTATGYSYKFKDTEEPSPIALFQTIRFKMLENAEKFIEDLQTKPNPADTLHEVVDVFLDDLTVQESYTPINAIRTLDYGIGD